MSGCPTIFLKKIGCEKMSKRENTEESVVKRGSGKKHKYTLEELQNINVLDITEVSKTKEPSDRVYVKDFKKIYTHIRKGLNVLNQQRMNKIISNQDALNSARELLSM